MKNKVLPAFFAFLLIFNSQIFSATFNEKLTDDERASLASGDILIRNIDFYRNMCLDLEGNEKAEFIKNEIHDLHPQYLAEVIQYKPLEGNEDLPQRLEEILYNVGDYAGIPYWSEQKQKWYDLYDSAEIVESREEDNKTLLKCIFKMQPFGIVDEEIILEQTPESVIYAATNMNKLRYLDKFDCVFPRKMKICIFLFKTDDQWILYGIGGVNAPRIPFFTERIETSFINRIKTFCNYIFKKF